MRLSRSTLPQASLAAASKATHPDPTRPPVFNDNGVETRPQGVFTRTASFQGLAAQSERDSKSLRGGGYFIISEPLNPESDPPVTAANAQLLSGNVGVCGKLVSYWGLCPSPPSPPMIFCYPRRARPLSL